MLSLPSHFRCKDSSDKKTLLRSHTKRRAQQTIENVEFRNYVFIINEYYSLDNVSTDTLEKINDHLINFKSKVPQRLNSCYRKYDNMNAKYSEWLGKPVLNEEIETIVRCHISDGKSTSTKSARNSKGRPKVRYEDLSDRGKRRRISGMKQELLDASISALREEGECLKANIIHDTSLSSPRTLSKLKNVCDAGCVEIKQYSAEQALAMIVDCNLSVDVYNTLRFSAIEQGADLYPSYYKVLQKIKKTYPKKHNSY